MTALKQVILAQIAAQGPMRLSDYMDLALLHPAHGYYTTRPPFGAAGDFITAPEISQMFGELLGLCLAQAWLDQGAPAPFVLAELGPGRGTLMADVLRATRAVAGFHAALQVHLVEASPALRQVQARGLAPAITPANLHWHARVEDLPSAPLFLLANEFFDALPIRQFHRQGAGWAEVVVGAQQGDLIFGKTPPLRVEALQDRLPHTPEGAIVEYCPAAAPIMQEITSRIARHGGAALIVDYGAWGGLGDTFQALRAHDYADPLADPGMADLTAHVDFAALSAPAQAAGLTCQFSTQGAFLTALGLPQRSAHLAQSLTGEALKTHLSAADRLTAAAQMGELFKVLGITPAGAAPLAGFAAPPTGLPQT